MHHTLVNYQRIYEKLGFLFYAIAAIDHDCEPGEADGLREMVRKFWLPIEDSTDEFGTDAAYYIDISFEYLLNEGFDAEEAFQEFENYYAEHSSVFSKTIKEKIKMTARAITHAFKGKNRKEATALKRLSRLLA
ncbi:MAG: hypothetical protein WA874_07920 [Chryseosolibacter sp.]